MEWESALGGGEVRTVIAWAGSQRRVWEGELGEVNEVLRGLGIAEIETGVAGDIAEMDAR